MGHAAQARKEAEAERGALARSRKEAEAERVALAMARREFEARTSREGAELGRLSAAGRAAPQPVVSEHPAAMTDARRAPETEPVERVQSVEAIARSTGHGTILVWQVAKDVVRRDVRMDDRLDPSEAASLRARLERGAPWQRFRDVRRSRSVEIGWQRAVTLDVFGREVQDAEYVDAGSAARFLQALGGEGLQPVPDYPSPRPVKRTPPVPSSPPAGDRATAAATLRGLVPDSVQDTAHLLRVASKVAGRPIAWGTPLTDREIALVEGCVKDLDSWLPYKKILGQAQREGISGKVVSSVARSLFGSVPGHHDVFPAGEVSRFISACRDASLVDGRAAPMSEGTLTAVGPEHVVRRQTNPQRPKSGGMTSLWKISGSLGVKKQNVVAAAEAVLGRLPAWEEALSEEASELVVRALRRSPAPAPAPAPVVRRALATPPCREQPPTGSSSGVAGSLAITGRVTLKALARRTQTRRAVADDAARSALGRSPAWTESLKVVEGEVVLGKIQSFRQALEFLPSGRRSLALVDIVAGTGLRDVTVAAHARQALGVAVPADRVLVPSDVIALVNLLLRPDERT
jgi:hypothetical protein